ncbi:AbrB/MazE/SpoVT family DNA-binding domain-containing protein [Paucilactobacillus vaccinostercus]|nr:AbrB/MazE/SpoVT family DNA-binding domain-containing protein [Paucilactobacillus vaccinostercus]
MTITKTSKVFQNGQVTVPVAIRDMLDIKPGV